MIFPVGDSPNPPGRPWVTYALIALNVLVYLGLFPLTLQAPSLEDPELIEYLTVIAGERQLNLAEVRQLAAQISAYDLVVFRYGFRPGAPSFLDALTSMLSP